MRTKQLLSAKQWLSSLFFVLLPLVEVIAQQFPIGTYWVATDRERYDQYPQVADCGINIISGGNYNGVSPLPNILAAAEASNITMLISGINGTDSLQWYGGSQSGYDSYRAYRLPYESDGYQPIPELQTIEHTLIYDFSHAVGEPLQEGGKTVWRATPSQGPGLLLHAYDDSEWQHLGYTYLATFVLKVDNNSGHVLVATVRIVEGTTNLVDEQIFSDNFTANGTYQEFEYEFTTSGSSLSGGGESEDDITSMLPEGSTESTMQVALDSLDYQVEYHGNRTLTVDRAIIENRWGDRLYDGHKDSDLLADVQWAFNQDGGDPTIRGFYTDEPQITRIDPMRYVNNLIGPITPSRFGFRETVQSTVCIDYVFNQYLNAGLPVNQDHKLLVDRYPIEYGAPEPGDPNYNNYIQGRWDGYLIPFLSDANFVSSLNGKPFWYAVQAHSWDLPSQQWHRDPAPIEIRCMANLGVVYGAKGIFYFLYTSIRSTYPAYEGAIGLVDINFNHNYEPYLSKWNEVQQINANLQYMASDLLSLNWQSAFTSGDAVPDGSVVQSITGGDYIEIGNFTHQTSGHPYIMLVNRRCEATDTQTISVTTNKTDQPYQIEDKLTGECYVTSDGIFRNISLEAGAGRLFEMTPVFDTNETWDYLINISSDVTIPTSKVLTITSGTTIKFASATELKINGTLNAYGTSANPITFTSASASPASGDWDWIKFDGGTGTVQYCDIEYAKFGLWFYGSSTNPTVTNCSVRNCSYYGAYFLNNSATTFQYNDLSDNSLHGLLLITSSPTLLNVTSTNNSSNGLFLSNSSPKIGSIDTTFSQQSQFADNTSDGIYCSGSSGSHPWIYRNSVSNPYGGYTQIIDNGSDGLTAIQKSHPILGSSASSQGNNSIYGNSAYQICNNNSDYSIYARHNWWGSANGYPAGSFYGTVVAVPYLTYQPGVGVSSSPNFVPAMASNETSRAADSLIENGEELMIQGKYEQAVPLFIQTTHEFPESAEARQALSSLVLCYREMGQANETLMMLDQYAEAYAQQQIGSWALNLSLPILELQGKYHSFIERCNLLLTEFSEHESVSDYLLFDLGMVYKYGVSDMESAKRYFEEFITAQPHDPLTEIALVEMNTIGSPQLFKGKPAEQKTASDHTLFDFEFFQNYPNPFNAETTIRYQLPQASAVTLTIYNLLGQQIRRLVNERQLAGNYSIIWDSRDEQGTVLSSGIYIYRLEAGFFVASKKLALIR
ncbi:MAG: right-handed parallel beta-helix repeat-containing protein [Candidatus Zhuqueibacterota bacterium]